MTKASYDDAAKEALRLVSGMIERHGPRLSGTAGCRAAAAELEGALKGLCSEAHRESFGMHPGSLFAIGKIIAFSYLIGVASLLLGSGIILGLGLLAMLLGAAFCVCQFILYLNVFDPLFKRIEGNNIVGSIEPSGHASRQVVIVAHHDSAPVYPFHESWPELYPLRIFLPIALFISCLGALSFAAASTLFAAGAPILPSWIKPVLVLGTAFVAPMYWFISKRASPGAGDDLIGCAIVIEIAKLFRGGREKLRRTRLVLLLADGEEAGQKGSKAFARRHRESMTRRDTSVINIDSVFDYKELGIIKRDRNGTTRLSEDLVRGLHAAAAERGHSPRILSIPLGGGGTDAAQFARKGIESVGIMADSTDAVRKEIVFHTMKDMPDRISAEAVSAVMEILCEYIASEDAGAED